MSVIREEHQQIQAQLGRWIADDPRRLAVLADLIMAIPLSRSLQSPDLAEHILRDVQNQSIAQMLRRFYMNEAITWETHYAPFLAQLLKHLALDTYFLVADTTDVGSAHRALVLSLAYHHRSLPLIWQVEAGSKGHTTAKCQVELLETLAPHFHPAAPVIFLGDSEFDGVQVQQLCHLQGWYFVCRTSPRLYVYPVTDTEGFPIGTLVPHPGAPPRQLARVMFTTKHHFGPISCYACWEDPHPTPLLLVYNLPLDRTPRATYNRRFWTEPLFADCQEQGFRLNTARLQETDRLSRLFLVVAAAYLWMVCLGVQIIQQGRADWVDRANRRTLSIFKTGWRWFKRQMKLDRIVLLNLTLPSNFELPALKFL